MRLAELEPPYSIARPWFARVVSACALAVLWVAGISGCQLAPSDPDKLARLRNEADVPTLAVTPAADTSHVGSLLRVDYSVSARHSAVSFLALEYTVDGASYAHIANLTPSGTNYTWTVPPEAADTHVVFRLRAITANGTAGSQVSFAVRIDTTDAAALTGLTLTNFLGGGIFAGGASMSVTFTPATGDLGADPLTFEYSADAGVTWISVAGRIANASPYRWVLPVIDSSSVRVRLSATDRTGAVVRSASTGNFEIDSTAPATPTVLARITPVAASGHLATPTIRVSGVVPGNTVQLFQDSTCTAGNRVASGVASGTTIDLTTSTLVEGAYVFYARTADGVGNLSSCSTASAAYSLDLTPPARPSALALVTPTASPGGTATPVIGVSGVTSGDSVELFSDSSCATTAVGSATAAGATVNVTAGALGVGVANTLYARATDAAGNVGACSTANIAYTYQLPIYTLSRSFYSMTDGGVAIAGGQLLVTRDVVGIAEDVTVQYGGVTAISGDFTTGSRTVSFSATDTARAIASSNAAPIATTELKGDKFFRARITGTSAGGKIGAIVDAQMNILDHRLAGDFFFPHALYSAVRADASVPIVVQRTGTLDAATVDLTFLNGSALGGTDFTATTRTLTFAIGAEESTTSVPLSATAGSKSFYVELKNPSGGHTVRPWSTAKVRIIDAFAGCDPTNDLLTTNDGFGGGDGTSSVTPYLICSLPQFYRLRNHPTAYFRLDADLDLDPSLDADPGTVGLQPFVAPNVNFSGVFQGGEHVLRNYRQSVSVTAGSPIGIFSTVGGNSSVTINALNVDLASVVSTIDANDIGGIAGSTSGGIGVISNCSFSGLVAAGKDGSAGGILARASGTMVSPLTRDFSHGLVRVADAGSGTGAGGIVGGILFGDSNTNASMDWTYSDATVFSPAGGTVGGLFGWSNYTFDVLVNLNHVHSKGLVRNLGSGDGGGLAGTLTVRGGSAQGIVQNSFSNSPVYVGGNAGGSVGAYACSDGTTGCSLSALMNHGTVVAENLTAGSPRYGGIVGRLSLDADATIGSLSSDGTVTANEIVYSMGGLIGYLVLNATSARTVTLTTLNNSGLVQDLSVGRGSYDVGGVVGSVELTSGDHSTLIFDGLVSSGTVYGGTYSTGGVIGSISVTSGWGTNSVRVTNSTSTSPLDGVHQVGGLIGILETNTAAGPTLRLDHSSYTGTVMTSGHDVGGAIGYLGSDQGTLVATLDHLTTAGLGKSDGYALGGIVGAVGVGGANNVFTISDVRSSMDLIATDASVGGIVGDFSYDADGGNSISFVRANVTGTISGTTDVGGLGGSLACGSSGYAGSKGFDFDRSSVNADISASSGGAGGFFGTVQSTVAGCNISFENLSGAGTVAAPDAGGMFSSVSGVGANVVSTSYTRANINGSVTRGGIFAVSGTFLSTGIYWNRGAGAGSAAIPGDGFDLTDAQCRVQGSFSGFDFTSVWTMSPGPYPSLQ